MLVSEIMSRAPVTVHLDDSLESVMKLFEERRFHHVLVVDDLKRLIGVVSDRDVLRAVSPFVSKLAERPMDVATLRRPVHQLMRRRPITIPPQDSVGEAAKLMLAHGCSCLPVVDTVGNVLGIVTSRDLLRLVEQRGAPSQA